MLGKGREAECITRLSQDNIEAIPVTNKPTILRVCGTSQAIVGDALKEIGDKCNKMCKEKVFDTPEDQALIKLLDEEQASIISTNSDHNIYILHTNSLCQNLLSINLSDIFIY